jgi:hypothetical protein
MFLDHAIHCLSILFLKNCSAHELQKRKKNELTHYSLYPLALSGWTGRVGNAGSMATGCSSWIW